MFDQVKGNLRFVNGNGVWYLKIMLCDLFADHQMHLDDSHIQLRLAVVCLLRARLGDFSAHFALKCSSLCTMNVGTSKRSPCCSVGFPEYPSVFMSNKLTERRWAYSVTTCFERNIFEPFSSSMVNRLCQFSHSPVDSVDNPNQSLCWLCWCHFFPGPALSSF
jgi:hypothetical protein